MENRVLFLDMLSMPDPSGYLVNREIDRRETDVFLSSPVSFSMCFNDWEEEKLNITFFNPEVVPFRDKVRKIADWLSVEDEDAHIQLCSWDLKRTIIPNLKLELIKMNYQPAKTLIKRFDRRPFEDYWALDLRDKAHMNWRLSMEQNYGYSLEHMSQLLGDYAFEAVSFDGELYEELGPLYDLFIDMLMGEKEGPMFDLGELLMRRRMQMIRHVYRKLEPWI